MKEHRDNPDAAQEPAARGRKHQWPDQAARSTHPQHQPAAGEHDTDRRVGDAKQHVGHRGQPVRARRLAAVSSSLGMKPRARLALSLDPYEAGLRLEVSTTTGWTVSSLMID